MKNSLRLMVMGLALSMPLVLQAGKPVFLITPVQTDPTTIYAGQTATATYRISNNTPYDLNGNGVINLPAGVTLRPCL